MEDKKIKSKKKNDQLFKLISLFIFILLVEIGAFGIGRNTRASMLADYGSQWILNTAENRVECPLSGIWTTIDTGHAMPQIISLNEGPGADFNPGYLHVADNGYGTDGDFKINFAYDQNRYHTLQASKDCNRMVLFMKIPNGDFTFHIGTYSKDPNSHTTQLGTHYYHYFHLTGNANRYWTKLLINKHPQHLVGEKYDPGDNPTSSMGWDYFNGMSRMYLEMKYSPWSNNSSLFSPYTVSVDQISFYKETRKENTFSINSLAVTYFGKGEFNIDWRSYSQYDVHHETFEVRYSTSPILSEEDYESAELVPGSPSGGWGQENIGHHKNDYRAHFTIDNIVPGQRYYFAIKDLYPGHPKEFTGIDYLVPSLSTPDTTPPTISLGSPSGTLSANTTSTTLSITTNENATCRYSTIANTTYDNMTNTMISTPVEQGGSTGQATHTTTITGLTNGGSYTYYIRCQDTSGNANTTDYPISFSIANPTPPTPTYTIANFISLITHWLGIGDQNSDVNNDGIVNARDLGIMMHYWK